MQTDGPIQADGGKWSKYQVAIGITLFVAMTFAFMDRINMAVVIPVWIKHYHISPAVAGLLASVFNWVYTASLVVVGPVVDRIRPRRAFPTGVGLWSLGTFLTGAGLGLPLLVFARGLMGVGESTVIPSSARIISNVYERKHRSKAVGFYFSGDKFGLTIGAPISALVLVHFGWHAVFYVTGAISALWLILWFAVYRPRKVLASASEGPERRVPWSALLKKRAVWGIMLGQFGYLYIFYVFVTWLPGYLTIQRHMTNLKSGYISMLPFLVAIATTIGGGWIADRLITRGKNVTAVRKVFVGGGLLFSTVFVLIASHVASTGLAVLALILSMGALGLATANCNTIPIDIAPRPVVSSVTSLQNFGGNVGGALAPIITGVLLSATHNFNLALLVAGAIAVLVGAVSYVFVLGKIEPMEFSRPGVEDTAVSV